MDTGDNTVFKCVLQSNKKHYHSKSPSDPKQNGTEIKIFFHILTHDVIRFVESAKNIEVDYPDWLFQIFSNPPEVGFLG